MRKFNRGEELGRFTSRKLAVAAIASAAVVGSVLVAAGPAFAAGYTAQATGVYIVGNVNFNSSSSPQAEVTGIGYDQAADGYGPYLRVVFNYSNGTNSGARITSCAAGNGGSCSLPAIYSSTSTVSSVTLNACTGAGGQLHACGPAVTVRR